VRFLATMTANNRKRRKDPQVTMNQDDVANRQPSSGVAEVLVVDDDAAVRKILRIALELDDFTVLEAENGTEGVSVAARHRPDFVVLDYMMPGLDGEATARRIRDVTPDAALVAFSAGLISPPYWADLFVPKANLAELPDVLHEHLALCRPPTQARGSSEAHPNATGGPRDSYTVLVVDDIAQIRDVVSRGFEASGFFTVVGEASDGMEAMAATAELHPDVIMLDLSMPNSGGLDALPGLRKSSPSSVIAVLSGIGPEVLGKAAWTSGADLYLQKAAPMKDIAAEVLCELQVRQSLLGAGAAADRSEQWS
jgi:DNA-binding response OmpR family regulator